MKKRILMVVVLCVTCCLLSTTVFAASGYQILVATFWGETYRLDVQSSTTIAQVKAQIQSQTGIPAGEQRVEFGGKELTVDSNTLLDHGIHSEATLRLRYPMSLSSQPSTPKTYKSQVNTPTNGTISIETDSYLLNEVVTFTVTPDEGYQVGEISVTYAQNGKKIAVTQLEDGSYRYKQPGAAAVVAVTFVATVEPEWYEPALCWAQEIELVAEDFVMDADCTRGDAIYLIWKAMGSPAATEENPFADLSGDAFYYEDALWAYGGGITKGTEDGATFSGEGHCDRSQIVTLLWRNDGMTQAEIGVALGDMVAGNWDYDAICWAVEGAIAEATDENQFGGARDCTQMEVIDLLFKQILSS